MKEKKDINIFQKYLTLWVFICMVLGVVIENTSQIFCNSL